MTEVLVEVMICSQATLDVLVFFIFPMILESSITCELSDECFSQQTISLRDEFGNERLQLHVAYVDVADRRHFNWLSVKNVYETPHHFVLVDPNLISRTECP
jgi:hypothetical protein